MTQHSNAPDQTAQPPAGAGHTSENGSHVRFAGGENASRYGALIFTLHHREGTPEVMVTTPDGMTKEALIHVSEAELVAVPLWETLAQAFPGMLTLELGGTALMVWNSVEGQFSLAGGLQPGSDRVNWVAGGHQRACEQLLDTAELHGWFWSAEHRERGRYTARVWRPETPEETREREHSSKWDGRARGWGKDRATAIARAMLAGSELDRVGWSGQTI